MSQPSLDSWVNQLNTWGKNRTPFLFIIDFELQKPKAFLLSDINTSDLQFNFNGFSNHPLNSPQNDPLQIHLSPIPFADYQRKFEVVHKHLSYGDSFLTNLTIRTPIRVNKSLEELFVQSEAKYKLLYKNEFLVFSPESFIKIKEGSIFSYPMKGTIDASVPHAVSNILSDQKELSEHVTIVDLIRNDLSLVAENVRVTKFRYIDSINTHAGTLLQVSSEIVGNLPANFNHQIGTILVSLLPAGSVSGAPKRKTVEIIQAAEGEPRGYYTGVMGYFDGENVDSAVMIRYIEQVEDQLFYRSGGGITTQSTCEKEYEEALAKVYVPVI
jgi:para-aminobenzoate synthetase component 1